MSAAAVRRISFKRVLEVLRCPEKRTQHLKILKHDVLVSCVGSTLIFGFGDIVAQNITPSQAQKARQAEGQDSNEATTSSSENNRLQMHEIEWNRAAVVASQGFLLNGMILAPFYHVLDIAVGDTAKKGAFWPGIPVKVLCVQSLYMPLAVSLFLFLTPFLEYCLSKAHRKVMAKISVAFPQYNVLVDVGQQKTSPEPSRMEAVVDRNAVAAKGNDVTRGSLLDAQKVADSTNELEMEPTNSVPVPSVDESMVPIEDNIRAAARRGLHELQHSFREVYETSWLFWPICDAINFRYIPLTYRPIWDSVVDILWTSYLSYTTHPPEEEEAKRLCDDDDGYRRPSFWRRVYNLVFAERSIQTTIITLESDPSSLADAAGVVHGPQPVSQL